MYVCMYVCMYGWMDGCMYVIAPFDKAADNVAFICKHFYALTIIKELNLDCHLSS